MTWDDGTAVDVWLVAKGPAKSQAAIAHRFSPEIEVTIDRLPSQGQSIVRVIVPPGRDVPYALDDNRFFVRDESETNLAVRDEIVRLVERRLLAASPDGTQIQFVHALTRSALYESFLPPRRRRIHRVVAEALMRRHVSDFSGALRQLV